MSFNTPSPADILTRLQGEIDIALAGADARVRRSVEAVLAKMLTMAEYELYRYLYWISRQILVDQADDDMLDRHGDIWGIPRTAATAATGPVRLTGTNGTVIAAGTELQRTDGVEYTLDADVTIAAGIGDGTVTASVAAAAGDADEGVKLTMISPVAGANGDVTVQAPGLSGGNDIESDTDYRTRILERIQSPPSGGSKTDYVEWAKEVSGVTRVWVYPLQLGDGTVEIMFVMDNKTDTIIPTAEEVAAVQDYIDGDAVRPVTADVTVAAPTAVPVDLTINLNPNTVAVQTAVTAELTDFFKRESEPGGTLYLSRINEAISAAAGEFDHAIALLDGAAAADVARSFGELSTLGDITWGDL
ncbi:MAG: baseplate J protein [Alphaproteobacteria bacterium]|nr:baseplate J protein [Alphaproteobacteria bacterium]